MAENRMDEALEKLDRGIQESKRAAQQQTMELAQEYFGDSVEALEQQIKDNRATLRGLPEQVPGGQEEPFQMMFQELMDNYGKVEEALNEAKKNVADLDPEQIRRQGEVEASDAAEEEPKASDVARRKAEELGVDLSRVEGTGSGGSITVKDVTSMAEGAQEQATTGQATQEAQDAAGQAVQGAQDTAGQVQDAAGQAAGQAQEVAGQVTDQAGQAAQGVQDTAGQVADQATEALGGVTDRDGQAAQGVQDTAGQATQQGQDAAGQATEQAGQAAGEDGSEEPRVTNAARRKAEELGVDLSEVQGTGAGGLIILKDVRGS